MCEHPLAVVFFFYKSVPQMNMQQSRRSILMKPSTICAYCSPEITFFIVSPASFIFSPPSSLPLSSLHSSFSLLLLQHHSLLLRNHHMCCLSLFTSPVARLFEIHTRALTCMNANVDIFKFLHKNIQKELHTNT